MLHFLCSFRKHSSYSVYVILLAENAACKLGRKKDLVSSLVTWCGTEDHPGVQGEANRLLAWLIKNSRYTD